MQIAADIALYVFDNNCIHRIMHLRRKLAVASNSLNGHISWDTDIILTANEEVNGVDADNVHGKKGDLNEMSITFVLAFYKYIWRSLFCLA